MESKSKCRGNGKVILDVRHDYHMGRYLSSFVPHRAIDLRHSVILMKIQLPK